MSRFAAARSALLAALLVAPFASGAAAAGELSAAHAPYSQFESQPQNALLLSEGPHGPRLLVLNVQDHRLEVFHGPSSVAGGAPPATSPPKSKGGAAGKAVVPGAGAGVGVIAPAGAYWRFHGEVFTGLEPVAMAQDPATQNRVFVANHLSDSVAVVDLDLMQVVATLPVGDEPRGLAIAGGRLFVACARAAATPPAPGQISAGAMEDAVVVVRAAAPPYAFAGNVPVPGSKPRDLLAWNGVVHVLPQDSGNRTTLLDENGTKANGIEQWTSDAHDAPMAWNPVLLRPELNPLNFARGWYVPNAGRIVFDHEWPAAVPQLDDRDVVGIDAATLSLVPQATYGAGTTLFDAERNPHDGTLWIAHTDAGNRLRFEPNLKGRAVKNRVAIAQPLGAVAAVIELGPPLLDRHYAQPSVVAFDAARGLAFVACLGSAAVLVFDARDRSFRGAIDTGALPQGLAVDTARGLLHVFCGGDRTIRTYDAAARFAPRGLARLSYDPEPPAVRAGRRHLYEARPDEGHGNGATSCASCHVGGHADALAWDLGDPGGSFAYYFPDVLDGFGSYSGQVVAAPTTPILHPLKGPMVTQSLRGLLDDTTTDDLPLHWRGDRRTFHAFSPAFRSLLGGTGVSPVAMQEFQSFLRALRVPPNPLQDRDRGYSGLAATGKDLFGLTPNVPGKPYSGAGVACAKCHQADFAGGTSFLGARPVASAGSFSQLFQTASTRQAYEKDDRARTGFGLLHDGAVDGIREFLDFVVPHGGNPTFPNFTAADKDAVAAFVTAFDSGAAPLLGAQFTLDAQSVAQADAFLDLAETRAGAAHRDVDLIVKGFRLFPGPSGQTLVLPRGALFEDQPSPRYRFDTGAVVDRAVLKAVAALGVATFTFTCVPPGQGERLGLDRDEDGLLDGQEASHDADPTRADSDGDGYADGFEVLHGSSPGVADAVLPDAAPPVFETALALDPSHEAASLRVLLSEPATLHAALGSHPGASDLGQAAESTLRRRHDLHLAGLPPATLVHVRLRATDRNGNPREHDLSFWTRPRQLHVAAVTLTKTGAAGGAVAVTGKVEVRDAASQPVADAPLLVFFAGDIGNQPWQRVGRTDAWGVATFALAPFTPAGPGTVALSPVFVGSLDPLDPFFVGKGGDAMPPFFYDQPANAASFATIAVP